MEREKTLAPQKLQLDPKPCKEQKIEKKKDFRRAKNEEEAPLALKQNRFRWILHVCFSLSGDGLLWTLATRDSEV